MTPLLETILRIPWLGAGVRTESIGDADTSPAIVDIRLTWTWDDYARISTELSTKLNGKAWGTGTLGQNEAALNLWARQNGESLWTKDGKLGVTQDKATDFFKYILKLRDAKALPSAEAVSQDLNAALDQSMMATGKLAMSFTCVSTGS